jgi:hypothetical protein
MLLRNRQYPKQNNFLPKVAVKKIEQEYAWHNTFHVTQRRAFWRKSISQQIAEMDCSTQYDTPTQT